MCLEHLNRLFGLVATVHVRWDLLMCEFLYVCDGLDVGCTGFIVEDLRVHFDATCLENFHDGIVGCRLRCDGGPLWIGRAVPRLHLPHCDM